VNEDDFMVSLFSTPGKPHILPKLQPRHNIAPNSQAPVIRRRNSATPDLQLQTMRWGIPYGKVHANNQQAINARSENIIEGAGMWNKYRGSNRCLVVSQG
jgi:putative SOS response-associated peptidase YedK